MEASIAWFGIVRQILNEGFRNCKVPHARDFAARLLRDDVNHRAPSLDSYLVDQTNEDKTLKNMFPRALTFIANGTEEMELCVLFL